MRRNQRGPEAAAYRALYSTTEWRSRRRQQLRAEPFCRYCKAQGIVTAATVADHVIPHRGDVDLFRGELQSLCDPCHSSAKQAEEARGYSTAIGLDGWPIDPKHPSRAADAQAARKCGRNVTKRAPTH